MSQLYSYCLPYDDGAAPNPYWGVCTLVICKPAIRRTAEIGDWIVGTGSTRSRIGNVSGMVVYAMRVTQKMKMRDYDLHTQEHLKGKIPDPTSSDVRRRLGDSIYDFRYDPPRLRSREVHSEGNREDDLSGYYALLSERFYYFGDHPVRLPEDLQKIVQQRQGHRKQKNTPFLPRFEEWLLGLNLEPNKLYGNPQMKLFSTCLTCKAP